MPGYYTICAEIPMPAQMRRDAEVWARSWDEIQRGVTAEFAAVFAPVSTGGENPGEMLASASD